MLGGNGRMKMDTVQRERVGARVTALRKERGWSQQRLAKEAGVSENTVLAVEKGTRQTQPDKLRRVLTALDVPERREGDLMLVDLPEDLQIFLRVAAQRLKSVPEQDRQRMLSDIYPRLLVDDP